MKVAHNIKGKNDIDIDTSSDPNVTIKKLLKENKELKLELSEQRIKYERITNQLNAMYYSVKTSHGNNELKGEALEILVFQNMKEYFSNDILREIKRGVRGVDLELDIYQDKKKAGTILIECKRTKNFSNKWLSKIEKKIDETPNSFGVLVYEGQNPYESILRDNVLICSLEELTAMTSIIRRLLVIKSNISIQIHGDKLKYINTKLQKKVNDIIKIVSKKHEMIVKERNYMKKMWDERSIDLNDMTDMLLEVQTNLIDN